MLSAPLSVAVVIDQGHVIVMKWSEHTSYISNQTVYDRIYLSKTIYPYSAQVYKMSTVYTIHTMILLEFACFDLLDFEYYNLWNNSQVF